MFPRLKHLENQKYLSILGPNKEPYNKTYINNYNNFYAWTWVIMQNVFFFIYGTHGPSNPEKEIPKNNGFQPLIDNVILFRPADALA